MFKPNLHRRPSSSPRWAMRFRNGYWTLFDLFNYQPVELFTLKKEADFALASILRPH